MGQLADRLAFLTTRYGSDPAAWQGEIHALAALERGAPREALARFHALKRRLVELRRADLLRELRAFPFVRDVPSSDTKGYPFKELESDVRAAVRALGHARAIAAALAEEDAARASLQLRAIADASPLSVASWDALAPLGEIAEARRRAAAREARLDRRLVDLGRRARRLPTPPAFPDAGLPGDALDAALDEFERAIAAAEGVEDAFAAALAPLKFPEVARYRHESRRRLEREAQDARSRADVEALRAIVARAEAVRVEAAALSSQAARSRRSGRAPPEGERRPGDALDGYG